MSNGMLKYSANLERKNVEEKDSAVDSWRNNRDADLMQAFNEGKHENLIGAGSMLRPRNFEMLLSTRPEALRPEYDKNVADYQKRLDYNNYMHDAMKADPSNKLQISPWTMLQAQPPPAVDETGKPVKLQWPPKP